MGESLLNQKIETGTSLPPFFSANKEKWNTIQIPGNSSWKAICYGDGTFLALADSGENPGIISTDGTVWNQADCPNHAWRSVCYSPNTSTFMAIATNGRIWTSYNYRTGRLLYNLPETYTWLSICFGNGYYIALSETEYAIRNERNNQWQLSTIPILSSWIKISYCGGLFIMLSKTGDLLFSYNGYDWQTSQISDTHGWIDITYGNGTFIAISASQDQNTIAISNDAQSWTLVTPPLDHKLSSITYGNNLFVIASDESTKIITSPDGMNWHVVSSGKTPIQTICYGMGMFIGLSTETGTLVTWGEKDKYPMPIKSGYQKIISNQSEILYPVSNQISTTTQTIDRNGRKLISSYDSAFPQLNNIPPHIYQYNGLSTSDIPFNREYQLAYNHHSVYLAVKVNGTTHDPYYISSDNGQSWEEFYWKDTNIDVNNYYPESVYGCSYVDNVFLLFKENQTYSSFAPLSLAWDHFNITIIAPDDPNIEEPITGITDIILISNTFIENNFDLLAILNINPYSSQYILCSYSDSKKRYEGLLQEHSEPLTSVCSTNKMAGIYCIAAARTGVLHIIKQDNEKVSNLFHVETPFYMDYHTEIDFITEVKTLDDICIARSLYSIWISKDDMFYQWDPIPYFNNENHEIEFQSLAIMNQYLVIIAKISDSYYYFTSKNGIDWFRDQIPNHENEPLYPSINRSQSYELNTDNRSPFLYSCGSNSYKHYLEEIYTLAQPEDVPYGTPFITWDHQIQAHVIKYGTKKSE